MDKETKPRIGIVNFERRSYPRFNVDLPIEYSLTQPPISSSGRAVNLSEGGLMIYLSGEVAIGQHLRLKLFFSKGADLNTISMMVEVVWMDIHWGEKWGEYRTGVRIVDTSAKDLEKLRKFLQSLSQ